MNDTTHTNPAHTNLARTNPADTNPESTSAASTPAVGTAAKPGRGIALSERAAKEIRRAMEENSFDPENSWIRVGAKGGGCSGFSYVLDFDSNGPTEYDLTFEQHDVKILIDKKSEFFMGGTELDFNDGLLDRGFVFKNPSATGTCGCGTSFSA